MKCSIGFLLLIASFSSFADYISGEGRIARVKDGDTFVIQSSATSRLYNAGMVLGEYNVNLKKQLFVLRVANIDTQESVHKDSSRNTDFGASTSEYVKNNFLDENISFTCYKKGNFDRAICSFSVNGKDFGIHMIENGYSTYLTKYGRHPTMHREYSNASGGVKGVLKSKAVNFVSGKVQQIKKMKGLYDKYKELQELRNN